MVIIQGNREVESPEQAPDPVGGLRTLKSLISYPVNAEEEAVKDRGGGTDTCKGLVSSVRKLRLSPK